MFGQLCKADRFFLRGHKLSAQERFAEASDAFERSLAIRSHPGVFLHAALALAETGRVEEAASMVQHAMAAQPTNPVFPMFLGQMLFDAADYAGARHWCAEALHLHPQNTHAQALQALIELASGDVRQGAARFCAPLTLPASSPEAVCMRFAHLRLPTLLHVANAAVQSRLLLLAETYLMRHGQQHDALAYQLLCTAPGGLAEQLLGAVDGGVTRLVMALRRSFAYAWTLLQPARRRRRLQRIAADEAYYLGHLDTALSAYTHLLSSCADDALIRERLVEICYERGAFGDALQYLRQHPAHTSPEQAPPAWPVGLLGELLYLSGAYEQAEAALQEAVRQRRHEYRPWYYLGLCKLRAGNKSPARRLFARAVQELHPDICRLRLDAMARVHRERSSSQTADDR